MSDVVQAYYFREVQLFYYGDAEPFGTYDRETKTLTIINEQAMGHLTRAQVQIDLDIAEASGRIAHTVMYGVPLNIWKLRQQAKYTSYEEM